MSINTQPLAAEDFSRGITDFFIDGEQREAKTMENLFITKNKKIKTRFGSEIYGPQLPLGAAKINKITKLKSQPVFFQGFRLFWNDANVWQEIEGPTGNPFFNEGSGSPVITDTEWRNHILFSTEDFYSTQKLFVDDSGDYVALTAGLPEIPAGVSVAAAPGANETYLYAFCFRYSYMNQQLEFLNFGPEFIFPSAVEGGIIALGNSAVVTLPTTLANNKNYDVAGFEIDIYRTTSNGNVFYLLDSVPFGTTTYNDVTTDDDLVTKPTIYTTGGVASYETPPLAKYIHAINDYAYYAHVKEGNDIDPTLVLQSSPGVVEGVPRSFFANTEQSITGLSSIFNRPIVFCEEYIYRIDNFYDSTGAGGMSLSRINDTAGCVSQESIVRTPIGIFWAGKEGFYWSDGFDVKLITPHLPKTYEGIVGSVTQQKNIKGTYDKAQERVYWTASVNETSVPDTIFTVHLQFREGDSRGCFTTLTGGESFRPTSLLQVGNYLYRGDSRGYVLRHTDNLLTDPKINAAIPTSQWNDSTIIYRYESCFLDFGSKFYRKFIPRILISAGNTTNLSLAIFSSNDNDRVMGELKPIRYTSNITWGDVFPIWGDPSSVWNTQGLIEEWRRFPAGGLRCNYKQIILTNAKTQIVTSDLLGLGAVNPTLKTMVVDAWPDGLTDYYIAFENDNYEKEFLVKSTTSTTLIYDDPSNTGPSVANNYKWVIRGFPKGQSLELNGYIIHWAFISKSHTPFSSGSLGSNPS
jgi:hypothetical protein